MQLTVLGTAAPFPVPGNACSGYLLRSGGGV
ncbi:MBL fold metallo-hydrolase, partial [Subtercola sp. Z020]